MICFMIQDTEIVLDTNWHSTSSQVSYIVIGIPENVIEFARPSPPIARCFTTQPHDQPGGEGLVTRQCKSSLVSILMEHEVVNPFPLTAFPEAIFSY